MILNLSYKELIIFILLLVIEYFLLYLYFGKNKTHSKFVLLFILFLTIKYLNKNYVFINNVYIILIISYFYYIYKEKEGFISKLKTLKDKNKYDDDNSNLNNSKSNKRVGINDYYNSFTDYKFTKKSKRALSALNKIPFFIEKFKEIF